MTSQNSGVFYGLSAALLFALSTPLAKTLLAGCPPLMLAALFYCGSGIGVLLLSIGRSLCASSQSEGGPGKNGLGIAPGEIKWLAPAVLAGGVLAPVAMMTGLSESAAAEASMLLNLEGVFTAVIAWYVFKENFDRRILLGMVAILLGGGLLSLGRASTTGFGAGFSLQPGALLIVLACLLWAIDNNFCKRVATSDPVRIAMIKGLTAGLVNLSLACMLGQRLPAAPLCSLALLTGFFSYGLSLVAYIAAQRRLGTARTAAYFASAPFVGALIAFFVLPEPLSANLPIAACLMAFGLWLHLSEDHNHQHQHAYMAHSHRHTHIVDVDGKVLEDVGQSCGGTADGDIHHAHRHEEFASEVPLDASGAHEHFHVHQPVSHRHKHYPDIHHEHTH